MRLLDQIIEKQTLIYEREVSQADYIIMDQDTVKEFRQDYIACYDGEEPSWEELQEIAGARIVVPLIGKIHGGFKFCSGIGTINRASV